MVGVGAPQLGVRGGGNKGKLKSCYGLDDALRRINGGGDEGGDDEGDEEDDEDDESYSEEDDSDESD